MEKQGSTKDELPVEINHHQVGADVWGEVVEEEAPEHEAFSLVDPTIHREQATHLAHQDGQPLVCCPGEGHQSLVPLEGVQGLAFCEAFLRDS